MNHKHYMQLALQEANKSQPSPNPKVGCVIVKKGLFKNKIISKAHHIKPAHEHAEILALKKAGKRAQNATMYVTLEPCSHYGKTPPCVNAIINSKIKKVVIAMKDPNQLVDSIKILKNNNIKVITGVLEKEAKQLNQKFIKYITTKTPFITLKAAITLDGKIATQTGHSKWISSKQSREHSHILRKNNDAILVGINTVLKDDPRLTCRIPQGKDPIRIIIDSKLRIHLNAKVLRDNNVILICSKKYNKKKYKLLKNKVKDIIICGKQQVNLKELIRELGKRNISSVLIEGGSKIHTSALKLADKIVLFIAPKIIGTGINIFNNLNIKTMDKSINLNTTQIRKIGNDIMVEGNQD